jgi:hypothetical protein
LDYQIQPNDALKTIYEWVPGTPSPFKLKQDELNKVPRKVSSGQGFGLSGPQRKAVDVQAMSVALQVLQDMGATEIVDVSKNESRDYTMIYQEAHWSVEVKGTTSEGCAEFFMTKNEKALHEEHRGHTALVLVSGIVLEGTKEEPKASGGSASVLIPWNCDEWAFEPMNYRVTRKA